MIVAYLPVQGEVWAVYSTGAGAHRRIRVQAWGVDERSHELTAMVAALGRGTERSCGSLSLSASTTPHGRRS